MDIRQQEISRDRLIFFSDAVFAIAMTLLALELVPREHHASDALLPAMIHSSRKVLGFAIGFAVIAAHWMAHVRNFRWIERADTPFMVLNLLMLMTVCFLPYPTAVLGEHGPGSRVAVTFYAASVTVLSLLQAVIWAYASIGRRLIANDTPRGLVRMVMARVLVPVIVFGTSIVIAQYNSQAAMYSWIAIAPLLMLTRLIGRQTA